MQKVVWKDEESCDSYEIETTNLIRDIECVQQASTIILAYI